MLDNKCQVSTEMQELREAARGRYVELRAPRLDGVKEVMKAKK